MEQGFSLDEEKSRLERLASIQKGVNPYSNKVTRTHTCEQAVFHAEELVKKSIPLTLAGRIFTLRKHGGSIFSDLEDESGRFQIYFKKDQLSAEQFSFIKDFVDRGDFLQVQGTLFKTKTGVITLLVSDFHFLTKSLLPLPEKWHGLTNTELRYRQRYLDLLANPVVRNNLRTRSMLVKNIRHFLDDHGFIEVETPILQPIPGGATARPFVTHHNSLDVDMYLRVAPELYLKRLLVGGFERVYEVARCFRNEGIDHNHNPEFTQVEFYYAYLDYVKLMKFTEDLLADVLMKTCGTLSFQYGKDTIDFTPPLPRIRFRDALLQYAKIDIEKYPDVSSLAKASKSLGVPVEKGDGKGKILDNVMKKFVRPALVQPTFLIDHPVELSPLARQNDADPRYVERFQLMVASEIELCNAFSELNNPLEQEKRFLEQENLRTSGDDEAQRHDADFVKALKYGMPPAAGFGMGIDRLAALITGAANLKEVIAFPTLRAKEE